MTLAEERRAGFSERGRAPLLSAYADDPYSWALEQAELLRTGQFELLDSQNLADEITALAHYLAAKLRSDLSRVLQHMLKWDYQPDRRTRSWAMTIREHRRRVAEHLQDGPGLKSALSGITARAYTDGREAALEETRLTSDLVPEACPYTWDEIMTRAIEWPQQG